MKSNRTILITGASSDLGDHLIRSIADEYEYILAHYNHSKGQIEKAVKLYGEKIVPLQADFANKSSVENMIADIGQERYPDHIVHLASPKFHVQKFHKEEVSAFEMEYMAAVQSMIQILKVFIPVMAKKKYGKIIFMLTSNVVGMPAKYQTCYTTCKFALLGLMRGLAVEYADKGICVNGISPDMIETKFLSDIPDLMIAQNAERSPLKKNLSVQDVIPALKFLLSDASEMITGINIPITGGAK